MNASKRIFAIAALIAPVLMAACADAPTEPQLQPAFARNLDLSVTRVTRTIGSSGGIITANGATLVIPAGALNRDVAITMTVTTGTEPAIALEPRGLVLQRPAQLSFPTRMETGINSATTSLETLDQAAAYGVWQLSEYLLTSKGLILVGG